MQQKAIVEQRAQGTGWSHRPGAAAGRAHPPAPLWHVAGAGHAGARWPEPEDRGCGRHSGPAGRALCGDPDAEAGRG